MSNRRPECEFPGRRATEPELMDDLDRPEQEFELAYRELEIINRWLGGVRAIERFLPDIPDLLILDVASGACDIGEALMARRRRRVVSLDLNLRGLRRAGRTSAVAGDAFQLPFADESFDVVMASLFFHHLSGNDCVRVLRSMFRVARRLVLVNDLHRHRVALAAIRILTGLFSRSAMVRHDGPLSVRRAFVPGDLAAIARRAGIEAHVHRSFPYRIVLVAEK